MATYEGRVTPGEMNWTVTVDKRPLNPRTDLFNHSPSGFSWGYNGSGPAQCALAILAHHLWRTRDLPKARADAEALRLHQDFKAAVIARLPKDQDFTLTSEQVEAALPDLRRSRMRSV